MGRIEKQYEYQGGIRYELIVWGHAVIVDEDLNGNLSGSVLDECPEHGYQSEFEVLEEAFGHVTDIDISKY